MRNDAGETTLPSSSTSSLDGLLSPHSRRQEVTVCLVNRPEKGDNLPAMSESPENASPESGRDVPLTEDLIEGSLVGSRQRNAHFMNGVRVIVTTGFLIVYAYGYFVLKDLGLGDTAPHLLLFWTVGTLLWFLGPRSSRILDASRFAVPLLDIPMVTWIQHANIRAADHPDAIAVFTLALFVFLTSLSSFSLRARHLIPTAVVGIVCLLTIYRAANLSALSMLTGPTLILMTAIMMSWLPRRQRALIREASEREARRNRLARYFSPGVAEFIEDRDDPGEGESCEISVLFCDIRGFTRLSENLEASDVVSLLNAFHGYMVDEIFRYGGTLDKYLGDGLLAWFNAPVRQKDHAVRAVNCALAMVESLETLNRDRAAAGDEPLHIGIGIHSGNAVVGNVGAAHRREFTAIGDTVNVASRLQSLTRDRDTDILISDAVLELIPESINREIAFHACGAAEVRGRRQSVEIFVPSRLALEQETH